jgi:hypothetical protein
MVFPCQNYSDRKDSVGRYSYRIWLRNIVLFPINRAIKVARGRQNLNHGVTETQRKALKNSVYSVTPWFKPG